MIRALVAVVVAVLSWMALLPAFIVAGALWLFAACVRGLARLMEPHFIPWTELMTFDRALGWRPRANLDAHYLAQRDDVFHVVTDAEGWPGTRSLAESPVVVIGDSFAFGYGIDTGSSFADLNPGLAIKGIGAPGYSMVHSVLLMEQLANRIAGKLVVWFVCLENDLEDNLSPSMNTYRSPFIRPSRRNGGWEIVQEHVDSTPWRSSVFSGPRLLSHLCVPGRIADRAYAGCDYLIGRGADLCNRIGAHLVLVTIPDPSQLTDEGRARSAEISGNPAAFDASMPDKRLAESCVRHGIPIIVGKDHLSALDYKRLEALHWNPRGHRRMAGVLGSLYESFRSNGSEGLPSKRRVTLGMEALASMDQSTAGSR